VDGEKDEDLTLLTFMNDKNKVFVPFLEVILSLDSLCFW
jgi:hypothetical protein